MNRSIPVDQDLGLKAQSRIVCFESCEIWFCGDKMVVDSRLPLPDLKLREFARPRIIFEGACYYVSEKSQSFGTSEPIFRYVLTPWPKNDHSITRPILLDEDYFQDVMAGRRRSRLESAAFKALVIFYPFLGFLWSPQKRGAEPNRVRVARDQQHVNVYGLSNRVLLRRVSRDF